MDEKTLTAQDCIDLLRQIKDVSFATTDDKDMAQMNHQVEAEGAEPADVAREFLQAHGLLDS